MAYVNGTKTQLLRAIQKRLGDDATMEDAYDMLEALEEQGFNWRTDSFAKLADWVIIETSTHMGIPCEE